MISSASTSPTLNPSPSPSHSHMHLRALAVISPAAVLLLRRTAILAPVPAMLFSSSPSSSPSPSPSPLPSSSSSSSHHVHASSPRHARLSAHRSSRMKSLTSPPAAASSSSSRRQCCFSPSYSYSHSQEEESLTARVSREDCTCVPDGPLKMVSEPPPLPAINKDWDESASTPLELQESGRGVASSPINKSSSISSSSSSSRGGKLPPRVSDLMDVPGIGPRNLEKLAAKGIERLSELKQLYLDKFHGDTSEKMVDYLRSSVGIVHKNHAESITAYLKDIVDEESKPDETFDQDHDASSRRRRQQGSRLTFCIEGNVSVGKSTFLQKITNEAVELRDLVEIVPEPVSKWQNVGPEHFNILNAFYAEPERYAYTFQNYVFVTRLMQEQESRKGLKPLRLMERSVFSDRMVFVRAVHEAKWMNEMEISIYDSWFDPVISALPGLVPDGFIYLRASPDTCLQRLQMRKRPEEQTVTLDYLRRLHEKHEQWLFPTETPQEAVMSISNWPLEMQEFLSPRIQGRVFYLQGDNIHSSIQKVPTLVLDCEASIDFTRDVEAKAEYARQVAEFCEFVKRTKKEEQVDRKASSGGGLILPQADRLLGPDGSFLHPQAFNPSYFNQRSSVLAK